MNSLTADEVIVTIIVIAIVAILALVIYEIIYGNRKRQEKFTKEYNIKHKTNFKTHSDLMNYIRSLREKERAKLEAKEREEKAKREALQQEEKRQKKERQGEEKAAESEPSGGSLTGKIARLQKLYKNGTLTKAEFEKAKNKLLKWKSLIKFGVGLVRDE